MLKNLLNIRIFEFTSKSLVFVQGFATLSALIGMWIFTFDTISILTAIIAYFLYIGIGVGMTLHRYYTHRCFEFRNSFIKKICTLIGLLAGRGSVLGWVYIHREHHAYADTDNDPHSPKKNGWKAIIMPIPRDSQNINKNLIKEFYTREHLLINRFYVLIIFTWLLILLSIDPWLFYFVWALPVAIGHLILNIFTHLGHSCGYQNFERKDNSKNFWPFGYLLFGEGWHNNHHHEPNNYTTSKKWWEIDIIGHVIEGIRK